MDEPSGPSNNGETGSSEGIAQNNIDDQKKIAQLG